MVISFRGVRYWPWLAVDNEGEVLDSMVQRRRKAKVAKKLMTKLLKKYGFAPTRIATDHRRSYSAAIKAMRLTPPPMTAVCARTTGRRTQINRSDDGSENCSGSSHRARPSAFSPSVPPPTTPSPTNAICSAYRTSSSFALPPSAHGRGLVPPHSMGSWDGVLCPGSVIVTKPT